MPLLTFLVVRTRVLGSVCDVLAAVVAAGLAWAGGYALTWVAKWAIATVALGTNVFANALSQSTIRTGLSSGEGESSLPRWFGLAINIRYALPVWVTTPLAVACSIFLEGFIIRLRDVATEDKLLVFGCILVSIIPLALYLGFAQHSWQHAFLTYRNMIAFLAAVLVFLVTAVRAITKAIRTEQPVPDAFTTDGKKSLKE